MNFKKKMNAEFGRETDVSEVKQQNQQAEAKKQRASGLFSSNFFQNANNKNVEFGQETDVNHVRQQNQQAEAKKQQASGRYSNNKNQNNQ